MSDIEKNKSSRPDAGLPAATPKPERSKIEGIRHTRRGIRPVRQSEQGKSQHPGIVAPEASAPETETRTAAESAAQDSAEKTKLAAEADRAKLDQSREELAREKDERRAAAFEAERRLAAVHRDLGNFHDAAAVARRSLSRERKIRVVAGFAAAVLICAAFFYRSMPRIPDLPVSPLAPGPPPRTAKLVPESQDALETPETSFTEGLDRLNLTLASAGGGKPEDAIRRIRNTLSPEVCPFVWRDGQVSLTFNEDTNLSSLTNTFSQCTDALARLP
jgi:hypothetical protein